MENIKRKMMEKIKDNFHSLCLSSHKYLCWLCSKLCFVKIFSLIYHLVINLHPTPDPCLSSFLNTYGRYAASTFCHYSLHNSVGWGLVNRYLFTFFLWTFFRNLWTHCNQDTMENVTEICWVVGRELSMY